MLKLALFDKRVVGALALLLTLIIDDRTVGSPIFVRGAYMFETEITLNQFNRHYLKELLADLPETELDHQVDPTSHSIRWILAHLAMAGDLGLGGIFGKPTVCPKTWHVAYGPKSQPGTNERVKPSKEELLTTIETVYKNLCESARAGDAEKLAANHTLELLFGTPLVTVHDLVAHLLATHFAIHVGQLSALRRQAGRPPLF
jgi:uncharacterized damage-inducible protein DinB